MGKRVKGYENWAPRAVNQDRLNKVLGLLERFGDQLPITGRQIFYQMVALHGYPKNAPEPLYDMLGRARRARMISFDWVRDDNAVRSSPPYEFNDPEHFWGSVRSTAEKYRKHRQAGQRIHIELWCEAAGMTHQLERVAHPYGVSVFSGGGFDSITTKHEAASRAIARYSKKEVLTTILHIGDHDWSGVTNFHVLEEDVEKMVDDEGFPGIVLVRRVAVRERHIKQFHLPTQEPKEIDVKNGWRGPTCQAEAYPPDVLATLVRTISKHSWTWICSTR